MIVTFDLRALLRHVTDDSGYCADAVRRSSEIITPSVKFNLLAIVLGLLILVTLLCAPVCESICRTSAPIYSVLNHSRILELLIVQVMVTSAPGIASGGLG